MPQRGIQFHILTNQSVQQVFQSTGSVRVLNPNDGVCYVALDRRATFTDWDHKLPSQSYGQLPGPLNNYISIYYVDQSGTGSAGDVVLYQSADQIDIPVFLAIGRAIQSQVTTVDIVQGTQPGNPSAGVTRLWSDTNGNMYRLLSTGANAELIDTSNFNTLVTIAGDVDGPLSATHVNVKSGSNINIASSASIQWNNDQNHKIWDNPAVNTMYFDEFGSWIWRATSRSNATVMSLDQNNLSLTGSLYVNAPASGGIFMVDQQAIRWPDAQHQISIYNQNVYFDLTADATHAWNFRNSAGTPLQVNSAGILVGGNVQLPASGAMVFFGDANHKYQSTGNNTYLGEYGGTFYFQNSQNSTTDFILTPNVLQLTQNQQIQWGNGSYIFPSGNDLYYRSLGSGYHYFQSTGGSGGTIVLGNLSASSTVDVATWIRCQSGTIYLTTLGGAVGIQVDNAGNGNWNAYAPNGSGNFRIQHADGSWCGSQAANFQVQSDIRYKTNVITVTDDECMTRLRTPDIPVITWTPDNPMPDSPSLRDIGFSAQAMAAAAPETVTVDDEGNHFLAYGQLTTVLWGALRQLDARVQWLEAHVHQISAPPVGNTGGPIAA